MINGDIGNETVLFTFDNGTFHILGTLDLQTIIPNFNQLFDDSTFQLEHPRANIFGFTISNASELAEGDFNCNFNTSFASNQTGIRVYFTKGW